MQGHDVKPIQQIIAEQAVLDPSDVTPDQSLADLGIEASDLFGGRS